MRKFIKNFKVKKICKPGLLLCFITLMLSACTGKEDIVLELSDSGTEQEITESAAVSYLEAGAVSEAEQPFGLEETSAAEISISAHETSSKQPLDTAQPEKIYVHICGAVVNPGVYELEEGSRVFGAVEAAGGFSEEACEDYVNLAGCLSDGERLVIPTMEEIETAKADGTYQALWMAGTAAANSETSTSKAPETQANESGMVNINTATENELGAISGIGAGKAAAIVKYRQENGNFTSIEDIMKVSGIKEGTYEKIKDKITVN